MIHFIILLFFSKTLIYHFGIITCKQKGYPSWTGKRLDDTDVQELFDGLENNGLTDDYSHILTGN